MLKTIELDEVLVKLPEIAPLLPSQLEACDLFICALGFEPRCVAIPESLMKRGYKATNAICIELNTSIGTNRVYADRLVAALGAIGSLCEPLNADASDYEAKLCELLAKLKVASGGALRVAFDVSAAANRLLLRTLKVLLESDISLDVIYVEAGTYHPTQEEFVSNPDKWTSDELLGTERGVSAIERCPAYAGQHVDPLPSCVILFPNFHKERSIAVVGHVDETLLTNRHQDIIWVIGIPHLASDKWRSDAMRTINSVPGDSLQIDVTTFDYRETIKTLERIYDDRWERYNITISPLGSKFQAIGIGLFCYLHPDVRVMFAAPKEYNAAEWSEGTRDMWLLPIGNTNELRALLDSFGTIGIR